MTGYSEHRYTSQDGLSLFYRDYNRYADRRTPVVCLSGLTRNSKDFQALAERIATKRRVVCPDYRGRGRSDYDQNWRNYQARTYINDVKHLLTLTNLHRVIFVGTSMGGILSAAMMAAAPTTVAGVILNDVGPTLDISGLSRIIDYVGTDRPQPDLESAVESLKTLLPRLKLRNELAWIEFADATYRKGSDGMYHYNWDLDLVRPLKEAGAEPLPDLWPHFKSLGRVPTLAFRGEISDVLSVETFEKMEEEIDGLKCVTVPGTGHAPTLAEPEAEKAIDAFLAEIDAS